MPIASPRDAGVNACEPGTLPGGQLAFSVGNGQANGIGVVNADGSGFRVVVEAKDTPGQPHGGTEAASWIGTGRIMFDSNRNGGPDDWHVFTAGFRSTPAEVSQVTGGADGIEYDAAMAPDGHAIVYAKAVADPDLVFRDAGLFVADADGRHERQLTSVPPGAVDEWPHFSPDGTRVTFSRIGGIDAGIWIVNLDGSSATRIVASDRVAQAIRPRWSSDGTRIAFSDNADAFQQHSANVWKVNTDGRGLVRITDASGGASGGQAFYPSWSPDDAFLLFIQNHAGSATNDLAAIPSDGGQSCTIWAGTSTMSAWDADWAGEDR
jgi:Tol biopolymer transport system component